MKHGTLALMLAGVLGMCAPTQAQISYVSQARFVQAARSNTTGIPPACNQVVNATDFGAFEQQAVCSAVTGVQHSSMGANTITCQGSASTESTPGLLTNNSTSQLTVVFEISEALHYTLAGQIGAPPTLSDIRLTGPGGVIHQANTAMNFDFCGTLAPGQYEIYSRARAIAGSSAMHAFTLRIVKPGDVNADDSVNITDLLGVVSAWGACANPQNCPADLTCDNAVNIADLLDVVSNWG